MLTLRFLFIGLLLFLPRLDPAAAMAVLPHVSEIRFGVYQSKTRVVLAIDGTVRPRVSTRLNPHRLVIELPDITWAPRIRMARKAGLVTHTDIRRLASGHVRFEFTTRGPVQVRKQFMLNPSGPLSRERKLVVDIERIRPVASRHAGKPTGRDRLSVGRDSAARSPVAPAVKPTGKPLIMLDPGHGGIDPGATARSGMKEKDIVLVFAKELRQVLENTGQYRVRMTREVDRLVALQERVEMALKSRADLFISLHADALSDESFGGFSVYTRDEQASDERAARLAARENLFDRIARPGLGDRDVEEVAGILGHIGSRAARNNSANFARILVAELRKIRSGVPHTHRSASFAVLRTVLTDPYVPSVLLELGFLTNRNDERMLKQPRQRAGLAAAVRRAVDRYFSAHATAARP